MDIMSRLLAPDRDQIGVRVTGV